MLEIFDLIINKKKGINFRIGIKNVKEHKNEEEGKKLFKHSTKTKQEQERKRKRKREKTTNIINFSIFHCSCFVLILA